MKIPHLEDYLITHNAADNFELLSALCHNLYNGQGNLGKISIKYDGLMAVIGKKDEKSFVSNKSYFNKKPILFFSKQEVLDHPNWCQEKKEKIIDFWEYHPVFPYKKDDFVRTGEYLKLNNNGRYQSNILEYEFEHLKDYGLGQNKNVILWHVDNQETKRSIEKFPIPSSMFSRVIEKQKSMGPDIFKKFSKEVNLAIWAGNNLPDICGYNEIIHKKFGELTASRYWEMIDLKTRLLNDMRKLIITPWIKVLYDGEETNHEGYVYKYRDIYVKLVDRFEFSRLNAQSVANRAWEK